MENKEVVDVGGVTGESLPEQCVSDLRSYGSCCYVQNADGSKDHVQLRDVRVSGCVGPEMTATEVKDRLDRFHNDAAEEFGGIAK